MKNVIETHTEGNNQEPRSALDELCLAGAQRMLHRALEIEVGPYLDRHCDKRDENGHARWQGQAEEGHDPDPARMEVTAPRVRDDRVDEDGERCRFTNEILPPYMRRSPKVLEVLPFLSLDGARDPERSDTGGLQLATPPEPAVPL